MRSICRNLGLSVIPMFFSLSSIAGILFDTASPPTTNTTIEISDNQWVYHRFQISATTALESVGGVFVNSGAADVIVFGAVISLSGPSDLPDSIDLTTADVVGTTLVSLPGSTYLASEFSAMINLQLAPGWYAIGFGTGAFGASSVSGGSAPGMKAHVNDLDPTQEMFLVNQSTGQVWPQSSLIARLFGTFKDNEIVRIGFEGAIRQIQVFDESGLGFPTALWGVSVGDAVTGAMTYDALTPADFIGLDTAEYRPRAAFQLDSTAISIYGAGINSDFIVSNNVYSSSVSAVVDNLFGTLENVSSLATSNSAPRTSVFW
jgi:hypothetical protein